MQLRKFAFWGGVVFALILGNVHWAGKDDDQASLKVAPFAISIAASSRPPVKAPVLEEQAGSFLDSAARSLGVNRELVFYGGIAVVGVIVMALAISSVAFNSKSRAEAQLEIVIQEKEKAENLARLKSEFLNQVSHELRTPLAVIIGYIECMTDGLYGQIETKHQEILQVVAKQSAHLKNMIDQILIYSRLEAGKQPVRIEELQLTKIISEMKDTFEFLCRQKGLELRWELPRDPMTIRSDAMRLKEVVSNLLQNAVKYTDHGSVTVRLQKVPMKDLLCIEVADTGMGISEQHLTSIFEPFMQAHKTSTTNSRGGIGLGLSIVKKHLEQVRGIVTVESELGRGSTFRITLPRNYDHPTSQRNWIHKLLRRPLGVTTKPASVKAALESARQKTIDTHHAIS